MQMKKLTTFFEKDPNDLGRVIDKVRAENEWVFNYGIATIKRDGTSCMIKDNVLYKRYDARLWRCKRGKIVKLTPTIPEGAIPCQEADEHTGHWPHWILCNANNSEDKYHFEAFNKKEYWEDGTYELCGPKIQGNPENLERHVLIKHGSEIAKIGLDVSFNAIQSFLAKTDIEGIVFHHKEDDRMCKIRKSDFGLKR